MPSQLLSPLYAGAAMRAIMSDRARLQRMLDFEAALARAEAAVGVITATGAVEIGEACQADRYNISALLETAGPSGNIAIAVVNALTVEVGRRNKQAAGFVHWGACSQDVIDTALVLELRAAIDALLVDLDIAIKGFTTLAGRHRRTLAVARTAMQQALPMPFGLKLAGYAAALARSRDRLARLRREALPLQFGGGAGTLAALGDRGFGVAERLAALLDLQLPDAPWHSHRDRLAEIASAFAILTGTCGKIARDVALMMQSEVGEAFEPEAPGRGVSSTLPHQRIASGAAAALSAATVAPNLVATILAAQVQEHERGLGGWQTEWLTFPALALVTSGALDAVVRVAEGIEIDVERLRANLELTGGRIMTEAIAFALAEKMGRSEAQRVLHELSQRAEKSKRPLKDLLAADLRVKSQLTSVELEKLFIPLTYQGSAQLFIERLVVASQSRGARRPEPRAAETKLPTAPQLPSVAAAETEAPPAETPPSAEPPPAEPPRVAPPLTAPVTARFEPSPPPPTPRLPPATPMAPVASPAPAPVTSSNQTTPTSPPATPTPVAPPPAAPPLVTPAPAVSLHVAYVVERDAVPEAAQPAAPTDSAEPPVPPSTPEAAPAASIEQPTPKEEPPPSDDAPGAFMDVLSRAEAEAQAAALSGNKRKLS
jgi:3-carboxy-cis,cis-muconate cycloisomerase